MKKRALSVASTYPLRYGGTHSEFMVFSSENISAGRTSERRACLWTCSDKGRKQSPRGVEEYKKGCGWTNVSVTRKWEGGNDWQGKCKQCGKRQRLRPMEVNVMPSKAEAIAEAERRNTALPEHDENGVYQREWL